MTTLKIDLKGKTKLPGIAPIIGKDVNAKALQATKENVEVLTGVRGDTLDQAVTYRALIDQGIVELARTNIGIGSSIIEIVTPVDPDDLEIPPTPTGLAANATFTEILVSWDQIFLNNYSNYSHTEVYRHTSDVIGDAIVMFTTSGKHFTDSVGYNTRMYYWVRHVSKQGKKSPYHPTVNGVTAITLASVSATMDELSESILNIPGYATLINTTVPALIDNAGASSTQIIRSNSAPTVRNDGSSALQGVDVWIDTDDNNQMYVRNAANNAWVKARDGTLVTLVNTVNTTVGDSGSGLVQSVASAQADIISATNARTALSASITNLTASVGTKGKIFRQDDPPTDDTLGANAAFPLEDNDLWFDTNDGKKMYSWNNTSNTWVEAGDTRIAGAATSTALQALTAATTATGSGITSHATKISALESTLGDGSGFATASALQSTNTSVTALQDGKNQTFTGNSEPVNNAANALKAGDLWIDSSDNNAFHRWSGSAWDEVADGRITSTATALTNLTAKVGTGNDADGTAYSATNTLAQHVTATENNAQSSFVLQTDANGAVAQMILHSEASAGSNPQSVITFKADSFAVWTGSGAITNRSSPFIIANDPDTSVPTVYIDTARIRDGAIEAAKIGSLNASSINAGFISVDRIEASTIEFNKLDANTITINTAMITNLAVGTAQIANAAITNAKIGSLYANVINGDVSKSASASMASSQTWNNLLSTASTYDYQDLLTVNLQKPTHTTGWSPYASFHINKMSTDKNSWSHIKLEMAIWNVNSVGTTANETATSGTTMSAFGTGFTGATIYNNYMAVTQQSQSVLNNEATLTWTTANLLGDEDGRINTNIAPSTSDFISDGTTHRQITSSARFQLNEQGISVDNWIITYDNPVSAWGSGTIYFREAVASGAVGKYMTKSKVDWIAVDGTGAGTAFNDTAIAATWFDGQGNTTIPYGVKAKMSISGHQQHGNNEQASGTQTVYAATGFLLGVR